MIGSSENRISYNGNGIATEFAYTFKILEKSDMKVLHVAADGTETLLTKDYYVDMEKNVVLYPGYAPGAEIPEQDRPPVLPVGERLVIYREVPITQASALDKHWPFNVVENGLDKLTIICQQIWDRLLRSFYASESISTNFDPKVPIEAGKTFRVKDDGTGFEVTEDPGKVIDGATALLEQTTEQANIALASSANAQNAAAKSETAANYAMQAAYSVMRAYYSKADMRKDTTLKIGDICTTTIAENPDDFLSDIYKIREKRENEYDGKYGAVFLDNGLVAEVVYHSVAYAEGYSYRVFGFLSSLKRFDSGFDDTTATIVDVCKTLPVYSTLQCPINASHTGFASFPYQYGILEVTKLPNRCYAKFYPHTLENVWVATYYWAKEDYSDAHFSTWYDISQHQSLQNKNPQRACDELIRVAETWLNRTFIYGRNCTSTDYGSITGPTTYKVTYNGTSYNEIDCAAFVRQVFAGIEYGRSKYYDDRNPWRFQKNYPWAIDLPWTWNSLLEMGYKNGWMIEAGVGYERLQKGDLVFWKADDEDSPEKPTFIKKAYRHISHVGIFTGRFVTERENAIAKGITNEITLNALNNVTLHPQTIEVQWVDNTPRTDVITYRLLDEEKIYENETTHRKDNIVMYARVPLQENVGVNTRDIIQYCQIPMYKNTKTRNSKTVFSYYHKADVIIQGDGNDIVIHNNTNNQYVTDEIVIGGILDNGTESIYSSSVRTGFVHINYTYMYAVDKGLDASKFYIIASRYYDKNMNWVTNAVTDDNKASVAFRRSVIKKNDNSEVTEEDLQEIKNTLYRVDDRFEQGYSKGLGYTIKIEASKIPKGYTCKRYNGNYCISADNKNWTPLDSETNAKLESIYLYDGENNFVVTTGQEVSLI